MATDTYERIVQEDLNTGIGNVSVSNPGGGTLTGTQVSLSSFAIGQQSYTTTWDPGAIAAGSFEAKDITVSGAALGDKVIGSFSLDVQDLQLDCRVTAANTVTCTLYNLTGAEVDLASGTLSVLVFNTL